MSNKINKLQKIVFETVQKIGLEVEEKEIKIEHPAEEKFGDYSTNIAMSLAKSQKKNPRELAETIKKAIEADKNEIIEKVEVAGAGFINFYLNQKFLIEELKKIVEEKEYRENLKKYGQGKTVVVDYSAPNIAKPFGVGHLRSTNIGQALYNIYQMLGWKCIGDNHLGDWGTQFGKLIVAIKKWWTEDQKNLTIDKLEELYVKFHKEAENKPELEAEGREWFAKLEKGDSEARSIWQLCVEISLKEFNRVYEILGVKIDHTLGESFYEDRLKDLVAEVEKKGITTKSQGATIIEFPDMPPAMLLKSDGATNYLTRDLATIKYRVEQWQPELIIYEVGADQILHFRQLFRIAEMMGWIKEKQLYHTAHGMIRWKDGKFSTRRGMTIHLEELIDKAMTEAAKFSKDEKVIKAVAIGAIKFNDLSQDPKRDIIFDWEKLMSLSGDSGPYLQYTQTRCTSVLAKLKSETETMAPKEIKPEELSLVRELLKLEEKIGEAAERYSPAVVAEYLQAVSRKYNEFYAKYRIIGETEENWRGFLTLATEKVLRIGLELLGIETVERM